MKTAFNLTLSLALFLACSDKKSGLSTFDSKTTYDTVIVSRHQHQTRPKFIMFYGIDSVARSDNSIEDTAVDSIKIRRISFKAKYVSCFRVKGTIKKELYEHLKTTHPEEYKEIIEMRTGHSLIVNDTMYNFSGRNNIDSNSFPDSGNVQAYASVYSLYSHRHHSGNIVIIDSMSVLKE